MKILHCADLHLESPLGGDEQLRQALRRVPEQIAELCRQEGCDLLLIAGDVFDGVPSKECVQAFRSCLERVGVPVVIAPGNHDFCGADSPWIGEDWPENVHIFKKPMMESIALPALDCRIYGAGFDSMDCASLLEGFRAQGEEAYRIGVLHGDPTQKNSPYNPISQAQVGASGLHYLALGHIHKGGSFTAKGTLCAWPGCPMGRGFDELEEKGVLIVTLEERAQARFVALDTPRFYDLTAEILTDPISAVAAVLPPAGSQDRYRVRLTGEAERVDIQAVEAAFGQVPYLQVRDQTVPVRDLWENMDRDSLEGLLFRRLHDVMTEGDGTALLAARICRKLLDGGEVQLP